MASARPRSRSLAGVAGIAVVVGLLAACGADTPDASPSSASPAAAEVPTELPADLPEGRGVVTVNPDGSRTVTSAWGTATVPERPERIVSVIGDVDLDALVALDVDVVGAGTQGGTATDGFAPHLGAGLAGVTPLAWSDGVPFESIAALEPDLIFAPDAETAATLDDIAPTVPRGSWSGAGWQDDFRYVASVLGREDDAERVVAEYTGRAADLRERLAGALPEGTTVASPQVSYDASSVYVDPSDAFSSAVLTDLGLALHPLVAGATGEGASLSFERLTELDADVLFWQVRQADDGSPDRAALAQATGSPLWPRLPAVQAGRVVEVVNRPWYFPGPTAAQVVLDDVERGLLGAGS